MRSHAFFSVETLGLFGIQCHMVLFVMMFQTGVVKIAGIRVDPDGACMQQIGRNLTDCGDGFPIGATCLIHDRDPVFADALSSLLRSSGIEPIKLPVRSPNLNPHAERFVESIKGECLNNFIFLGEKHLRYVIDEYVNFYHARRTHQGLSGKLLRHPKAAANDDGNDGPVRCQSQLGGMLNYYYQEAA